MLVYIDSSVLARAYLPDEDGHAAALALLVDPEHVLVSASWTVVEVTSALARAVKAGRGAASLEGLLALLGQDTSEDGAVTLLRAEAEMVEVRTTQIVRDYAIRSLDALHLAVAELAARPLVEPGQPVAFATRDQAQLTVARALGYASV